jgi:hypothetical protein
VLRAGFETPSFSVAAGVGYGQIPVATTDDLCREVVAARYDEMTKLPLKLVIETRPVDFGTRAPRRDDPPRHHRRDFGEPFFAPAGT